MYLIILKENSNKKKKKTNFSHLAKQKSFEIKIQFILFRTKSEKCSCIS